MWRTLFDSEIESQTVFLGDFVCEKGWKEKDNKAMETASRSLLWH